MCQRPCLVLKRDAALDPALREKTQAKQHQPDLIKTRRKQHRRKNVAKGQSQGEKRDKGKTPPPRGRIKDQNKGKDSPQCNKKVHTGRVRPEQKKEKKRSRADSCCSTSLSDNVSSSSSVSSLCSFNDASTRQLNEFDEKTCHVAVSASSETGSKRRGRRSKRRGRRKNGVEPRKRKTEIMDPTDPYLTEEIKSRFVAMDCEMIGTGPDGQTSTLARVSLVDWDENVLLDTYVKVFGPVTDLRTFVSGVTLSDIDPSSPHAMELSECVSEVKRLLDGKILVGHALKNDLRALNISHPWFDTRDTAKFTPFMKTDGNVHLPRKLKDLAQTKLGLNIQCETKAHSSVEDASAAMKLYKLVRLKWEKVMEYKMQKTIEITGLRRLYDEIKTAG